MRMMEVFILKFQFIAECRIPEIFNKWWGRGKERERERSAVERVVLNRYMYLELMKPWRKDEYESGYAWNLNLLPVSLLSQEAPPSPMLLLLMVWPTRMEIKGHWFILRQAARSLRSALAMVCYTLSTCTLYAIHTYMYVHVFVHENFNSLVPKVQKFRPNWASSMQCSTRWASYLNRRPKAPWGFK